MIFKSCPEGNNLIWPGRGKPFAFPGVGAVSWWHLWDASHDPVLGSLCQPVAMQMSLGKGRNIFIAMKATRNGPKWGPRGTATVKSNLGQGLCSRIQSTCKICPEGFVSAGSASWQCCRREVTSAGGSGGLGLVWGCPRVSAELGLLQNVE